MRALGPSVGPERSCKAMSETNSRDFLKKSFLVLLELSLHLCDNIMDEDFSESSLYLWVFFIGHNLIFNFSRSQKLWRELKHISRNASGDT